MGPRARRWFAPFPLALLALALLGAPAAPAWAAKHKKASKTWPKKSSHKKSAAPASKDEDAAAAQKGGDDDEADDAKPAAKAKPKSAAKSKVKMDDDGDDKDAHAAAAKGEDEEGGDEEGETVVRKKASKPAAEEGEGGALVALDLEIGSRGVHRTFDFNDPRFYAGTTPPGAYKLQAAPVPFLHLGIYPLAFAGRDGLANLGIVGRYERLIGTTTVDKSGSGLPSSTTSGQEFDIGLRGRLPVGGGEVGLAATYGQHTFLLSSTDQPPGTATVPNVEYTFFRADLDGALPLGPVTLGGHLGSRFVPKTGALGKWFGTTKTTSIEAGLSVAYKLTPMFDVVGGVDFLRYAFAFNPPTNNGIIAGGAVDQYISGYLALRVSIAGN